LNECELSAESALERLETDELSFVTYAHVANLSGLPIDEDFDSTQQHVLGDQVRVLLTKIVTFGFDPGALRLDHAVPDHHASRATTLEDDDVAHLELTNERRLQDQKILGRNGRLHRVRVCHAHEGPANHLYVSASAHQRHDRRDVSKRRIGV